MSDGTPLIVLDMEALSYDAHLFVGQIQDQRHHELQTLIERAILLGTGGERIAAVTAELMRRQGVPVVLARWDPAAETVETSVALPRGCG